MMQQVIKSQSPSGKWVLSNVLDQYVSQALTYTQIDFVPTLIDDIMFVHRDGIDYQRDHSIVDVRWFGAKGDGSDCSAQMNKAISYCNEYGVSLLYCPSGIYTIDSTIIAKSNVYIVGDGSKTVFRAKANADTENNLTFNLFLIAGVTNGGVSNILFDANKVNQVKQYLGDLTTINGIYITKPTSNDFYIRDCMFKDLYNAIYANADGASRNRFYIQNNKCDGGRNGIVCSSLINSVVSNNTVSNCMSAALNINYAQGTKVLHNTIQNVFYNGIKTMWAASTSKTLGSIGYPTIANSSLYRVIQAGTTGSTEPSNWLTTNVTDGTVVWERIQFTATPAMNLTASKRCIVAHNTIQFCASHGILLTSGADDNIIQGNNVTQPGYISASTGNDRLNGNPSANGIGIFSGGAAGSYRNIVNGNHLYLTAGYGISIINDCEFNVVTGNFIYDSQDPGIAVIGSNSTISGNVFTECNGDCIVIGPDSDGGDFIAENVTVTGNSGSNGAKGLVWVNGGRYISISGNTGKNMGSNATFTSLQRSGIVITAKGSLNPSHISVMGNILIGSGGYGIACENEDYVTFCGNTIADSVTSDVIQQTGANNKLIG